MDILDPAVTQALLRNRTANNGEAGAAWIRDLPRLVADAAARWSLTLEPHYPNLSYNYVAPVSLDDGTPAVLKLCFPDPDGDFLREEQALRAFDGRAAVRLLESNLSLSALLLERLEPGLDVTSLNDDESEVAATSAVMHELWRPPPPKHSFPSMSDWIEGMASTGAASNHPLDWLDSGVALGRELVAHAEAPSVLLHGDLHHYNVLVSQRGWLCIDPHGVTGEPAWEIAPYLYNNLPDAAGEPAWRRVIRRRAGQFADVLTLDRHRVHACAAVYAAISSSWSFDENDWRPVWFAKHRAVMQEVGGF